jgi:hypothetical protein
MYSIVTESSPLLPVADVQRRTFIHLKFLTLASVPCTSVRGVDYTVTDRQTYTHTCGTSSS